VLLGAVWAVSSVAILVSLVVASLARPVRRRAMAEALVRARYRLAERARLRLAAVLLDLGDHLMLCGEERRARRLQKKLSGRRARRLGLKAVALRLGARRADEVTLEIPVGAREQEGNTTRTLALSCVLYGLPGEDPRVCWRVVNRPSPGYRGSSVTVEVPTLERALITYHARSLLPPEHGGRFFDEDVHNDVGTTAFFGDWAV
jgi:hypothetical protein